MSHAGKGADRSPAAISKEHRREINDALGLTFQLGVSMFSCLFIGVVLGRTLDVWLHTSPAMLLVGSLLGGLASLKALYDLIIKKWMK